MAEIFTKAQSTVISNGTELEKIINNKSKRVENLDAFIETCNTANKGTYLCTKKEVRASKNYKLPGHEPDFLVFKVGRNTTENSCYIVELKDGDAFDTKKSLAEKEMLQLFEHHIAPKIPFKTKHFICCFNQPDKDAIVAGFKNTFTRDEVLSGVEFCRILGIDHNEIVAIRKADTADNFAYVVEKMIEIHAVRASMLKEYRKRISKDDFYKSL